MPPDYVKSVRFKKCPISLIDNSEQDITSSENSTKVTKREIIYDSFKLSCPFL